MKIDIYNMEGKTVGDIELNDAVFALEPHHDLLHRAVHTYLCNQRQGTSKTKGRSEVRGGGRKPYRQKGTGRARHGSIRSAQYVGGGIIFGPQPRSYSIKLPKKMRQLAMKSALSALVADQRVKVLDKLELNEIKTKNFVKILKNLELNKSVLCVESTRDENIERSAANLPQVKTTLVNTLNVHDLLKYDTLLLTKDAILQIQEVYA